MMRNEQRILSEKEQEPLYSTYARMEDLLDKLKLLNYESEFLSGLKIKPIHKFYFAVTKNPGEQFYLFSILAAWLIRKNGRPFEQPQEFDDPNETVDRILNEVKENGMVVDFSPNKIKQGVGEYVVAILDYLANIALTKNNIILKKPKLPEEKEEETEIIDDESEINLDKIEEEMIAAYSDDSDEENIFRLDELKPIKKEVQATQFKSNIDEETWKLEVERVLPLLKVTIKNDNRDWRSHLEQMKQHQSTIDNGFGSAKGQLEKLHKEITTTLDKINNREKYFNRELESVLEEYRSLQDQLSKLKDTYKSVSTGVAERNRELYQLTEKLESVKRQMEERGSSMTDGTPLVNIKKSVAKVKAEIVDMDVRIGVLECILLQTKLREEKQIETEFGQSISVF
ncbi:intraflagellar transport protein 57 homolog isoform X1 [Diorhabda carinulata]|uniref:intraflagellar transport protein 57 homolog isoform X1 n=1 Tax=Diorhabda carinulata TaxID=1163345 RepID=UPI0025A154F4|nr:intraflagellar transport protein 57 homolog isoform X1 [Diorhabda carinulata]